MKSRWLRGAALLVAGAVLFWLLPWLVLKWSGYLLVVFPNGGDRSQTTVVDFEPRGRIAPLPQPPGGAVPRNIVFLLADGLGFPQLYAARLAKHGAHGRLTMEQFPVTGWQTNPSLDDVYTDSASSASSLYTGHKIVTRALSVDSHGRPLRTLAEDLHDRGWAVGLITDSYLWDASLAAHAVHHGRRYDLPVVSRQLAESGFDLLVGSWPAEDEIRVDLHGGLESLVAPLRSAGYQVVDDPDQLPHDPGPIAVVYASGSIASGQPALAELTDWALRRLTANNRPAFLFVETEQPDSGGHNRDFARVRSGLLALDDAARAAIDFAMGTTDAGSVSTLVLATGDHETGGFSILSGSAKQPLAIRWATPRHTAAPVPVLAWGVGAERFSGVMDNTEIPQRLRDLASDPP